ncbi:MAG TPA: polysaccharide deacetylase family protein [Symbiobacteriaceae bacterium]|nr:polysaccharide deacetylase family protein [Symbiobacteriaceae bacterium]
MEALVRRLAVPLLLAASVSMSSVAWASPQVVYSGNGQCRDIAMTFDTEFTSTTQTLIDTIDSLGIKTTWFFLGDSVRAYPQIVQQVSQRHEIGNHSYSHPDMTTLSAADMHWQLDIARSRIIEVSGQDPRPIWRPPYGSWNNTVARVAEEEGYPYTVLWSIDTRDWAGPSAETIRQRIVNGAFPGAIVLQHGSPRNTVEATRLAVPELKARGYQFVTVSEILGIGRTARDFGGDTYAVQPGDTPAWVAGCHNITAGRLMAYNEVPALWVGWTLKIPHRSEIIICVDGVRQRFDVYPRLVGDRSVAPVRLAERLGATVEWNGTSAIITKGAKRIEVTPGSQTALVNGQPVAMLAPAFEENGRILVPVRFLAEQLGATVAFDGETYTVAIQQPAPTAAPATAPAAEAPAGPPAPGVPAGSQTAH